MMNEIGVYIESLKMEFKQKEMQSKIEVKNTQN